MPRPPRILIAHQPHHVIQRGHRRQTVFEHPGDYRAYLDDLHAQRAALGVALHAWCLMPNHVHLLLAPGGDPTTVSVLMQRIARQASYRWNRRRRTSGSLWEARFTSRVIDSERYLLACCRYIELNPVRAALTRDPAGYPWSSYRARMGLADGAKLDPHALYLAMGNNEAERRRAYRHFMGSASEAGMGQKQGV